MAESNDKFQSDNAIIQECLDVIRNHAYKKITVFDLGPTSFYVYRDDKNRMFDICEFAMISPKHYILGKDGINYHSDYIGFSDLEKLFKVCEEREDEEWRAAQKNKLSQNSETAEPKEIEEPMVESNVCEIDSPIIKECSDILRNHEYDEISAISLNGHTYLSVLRGRNPKKQVQLFSISKFAMVAPVRYLLGKGDKDYHDEDKGFANLEELFNLCKIAFVEQQHQDTAKKSLSWFERAKLFLRNLEKNKRLK